MPEATSSTPDTDALRFSYYEYRCEKGFMPITATLDRFEGESGELAVLVVEPGRIVLNVPRSHLQRSEPGRRVYREGRVDREETDRRREEVGEKIERLKRRGGREE